MKFLIPAFYFLDSRFEDSAEWHYARRYVHTFLLTRLHPKRAQSLQILETERQQRQFFRKQEKAKRAELAKQAVEAAPGAPFVPSEPMEQGRLMVAIRPYLLK